MRWTGAILGIALAAAAAAGEPPRVPVAEDLAAAGRAAEGSGRALMLVFSASDCGYCHVLDREILEPMVRSGEYDGTVLIRKVMLDPGESVRDFGGREVETHRLADRYGVFVTPTVLFVDAAGRELAPRLVGINTVELYGAYLDEAIARAVARVRARGHVARSGVEDEEAVSD